MVVSWPAGGSIEADQDPGVTDNDGQVQHSGVAPGADLYLFRVGGSGGIAHAIESALEDWADIVNLPLSFSRSLPESVCNIFMNCSGLNETIGNATGV